MCSPQLPGTEGSKIFRRDLTQTESSGKEGERKEGRAWPEKTFCSPRSCKPIRHRVSENLKLPLKQGRRGTHRSLLRDIGVSRYLQVFLVYAGCEGKEPSRLYQSCLLYKQETHTQLSVLQLLCWWNIYENS